MFCKSEKFRDAGTKPTKHNQTNDSPKFFLNRNTLFSKTKLLLFKRTVTSNSRPVELKFARVHVNEF